jgi:hypothetical protein
MMEHDTAFVVVGVQYAAFALLPPLLNELFCGNRQRLSQTYAMVLVSKLYVFCGCQKHAGSMRCLCVVYEQT